MSADLTYNYPNATDVTYVPRGTTPHNKDVYYRAEQGGVEADALDTQDALVLRDGTYGDGLVIVGNLEELREFAKAVATAVGLAVSVEKSQARTRSSTAHSIRQ